MFSQAWTYEPWRRAYARAVALALVVTACLCLAACRVDLYSSLSEKDANEIIAVLTENGISATKVASDGAYAVRVLEADIAQAVAVLSAKGLPREKSATLGSTFQKSGIISSPFEDRVRYIYALGEEVAATIREIDGVISARVHVVLPEQSQFGSTPKPSSAAVFIKHEPLVDLDYLVPQIRRLVSSSIEGLDPSAVTVLLTEGASREREVKTVSETMVDVLPGFAVRESDVIRFWRIIYIGGLAIAALVIIVIGSLAYFIFFRDAYGWFRANEEDEQRGATDLS